MFPLFCTDHNSRECSNQFIAVVSYASGGYRAVQEEVHCGRGGGGAGLPTAREGGIRLPPPRCSVEETDAHLLLHVHFLQHLLEFCEGDGVVSVLVGLLDGAVGDAAQLLVGDVHAHHHAQHLQELVSRNLLILVQVIEPEGELEFARAAVEGCGGVRIFLLDSVHRPEMCKGAHEPTEIHLVLPLGEERVDDAVSQRVDGQLRNALEILAAQRAVFSLVQAREAAVKARDLAVGKPRLLLDLLDLLVAQEGRGPGAHGDGDGGCGDGGGERR